MDRHAARELLVHCFEQGLAAVDPEEAVATKLKDYRDEKRLVVFAIGKAAPAMARGAARALGRPELEGIAVSNHADAVPTGMEMIVSAHPLPDERSMEAGSALLRLADSLTAADRAVVLISGGGSALVEVLVEGVSLEDLTRTSEALLRSGGDIGQINVIRRRLSLLKGGGLARAIAPAVVETLAISDVIGDDPATIASGPTVVGTDKPGAAWEIVQTLGLEHSLPAPVRDALLASPPSYAAPAAGRFSVIAGGPVAAHAAAAAAERRGLPAAVVDTRLEGEASVVAGEALERSSASVSVFAGETTVTLHGNGVGGRNQEAALAAATLISGRPDVYFLAAGTDGIDGTSAAAGAFVDGTTLHRARARGLDAATALEDNDSGSFFAQLGDQLVTGPTGTNVGDLWLVLRN
jgi:hydroxypyruvate reductase